MSGNQNEIALKNLLLNWKLEKLYETLKDEDIFVEELEMMTMEHLETLLKNCKMGVRIRFEHYFKKWRRDQGKPLETIVDQCFENQKQNQSTATTTVAFTQTPKVIEINEQATQVDNNYKTKTTKQKSTQTTAEFNDSKTSIVKVLQGAEQIRLVLNQIDKYKSNESKQQKSIQQQLPQIPATITQIMKLKVSNNNLNLEQPTTTTTFPDAPRGSTAGQGLSNNLGCVEGSLTKPQSTAATTTTTFPDTIIPISLPLQIKQIQQNLLHLPEANETLNQPTNSSFIIPKASLASNTTNQTERPIIPKASLKIKPDTTLRRSCLTITQQTPEKIKLPCALKRSIPAENLPLELMLKKLSTKKILPSEAKLKKMSPDTTHSVIPKTQKLITNSSAANAAQIYLLRKYGSGGFKNCDEQLKMIGTSVLKILIESGKEGQQILQQYEESPMITDQQRELIIDLICNYYKKNDVAFNLTTSYCLEEQLLELFPSEKLEFYRTEEHGKIYKKYYCDSPSEFISIDDSSSSSESETFSKNSKKNNLNLIVNNNPLDSTDSDNSNEIDVKLEYSSD